jgi:hypothetical protein
MHTNVKGRAKLQREFPVLVLHSNAQSQMRMPATIGQDIYLSSAYNRKIRELGT